MARAFLAPTLVRLRDDLNSRWPGRDKTTDGWIGDASHQAQVSDHNPDKKSGVVRALDIDKDGIHIPSVLASIMIHPSTNYVIHNHRMMRRGDRFKPRAYEGSNPHTSHIHDSIMHSPGSENSKTEFTILKYGTSTWKNKTLRLEVAGWEVRELQALLNAYGFALYLDSVFGANTDSAVRQFQRAMGIESDGIVGPITRSKLTPGLS
jgi:hypothetical protein